MTAKDLISVLASMPPDANVTYLWDGGARSIIEKVWLARSGEVVIADNDEICLNTSDRPVNAPTAKECHGWYSNDYIPPPLQ